MRANGPTLFQEDGGYPLKCVRQLGLMVRPYLHDGRDRFRDDYFVTLPFPDVGLVIPMMALFGLGLV